MNRYWVISVLLAFTSMGLAQNVSYQWRDLYSDHAYAALCTFSDMKTDAAGNTFMVGSKMDGVEDFNMVLIGYNQTGDTILHVVYDDVDHPGASDSASKLYLDADGNIIIIGTVLEDGSYPKTVVFKYNRLGELLWTYKYGNKNGYKHYMMQCGFDASGWLYMLMQNESMERYSLVTVSNLGQEVDRLSMSQLYDGYSSLKLDVPNGAIYKYNSKVCRKYNLQGELIWENRRLYEHNLSVYECYADGEGSLFFAGVEQVPNTNNYIYKIVKYSASGQYIWTGQKNSQARETHLRKVLPTNEGGLLLVYQNRSESYVGSIYVIQFNAAGKYVNEFELQNSWGKWKEFDDMLITKDNVIFYAARNCDQKPSYNDVVQRAEIGVLEFTGLAKWQKELTAASDTLINVSLVQEGTNGDLCVGYRLKFSRGTDEEQPKDMEYVFARYDENGNEQIVRSCRSEGFSNVEPFRLMAGDDGDTYVLGLSDVAGIRKEFVILKYDAAGRRLWTQRYGDETMQYMEVKRVGRTADGRIKVIYSYQLKNEKGYYERFYRALNFTSDGEMASAKAIGQLNSDQGLVLLTEGSYGIGMWANDSSRFCFYNSHDVLKWEKNLSDDSFIKNAKLAGSDMEDQIYFYADKQLTKVDTNGERLWQCQLPLGEIKINGIESWADGHVLFWFDEEVGYYYKQIGLCRFDSNGQLDWHVSSDTLKYGVKAVPLKDGGVAVLGQLKESIYGRGHDVASLVKFDVSGKVVNRNDLRFYPYLFGNASSGRFAQPNTNGPFFIAADNKLLKFDEYGEYKGGTDFSGFNPGVASLVVRDMLLTDNDKLMMTASLSRQDNFNYMKWHVINNSSIASAALDKPTNHPPVFVVDSSAIGNFEIDTVAIDPDGDPIIYSLGDDVEHWFKVYPRMGHLTTENGYVPRGNFPMVIRATDPHGDYSELKYTY